jgi:hypothetical protein
VRPDRYYFARVTPAARRTALWVTAYAMAMGVLEAAVVIYLRRLYFPSGFQFPVRLVDTDIGIVELWRELATVVMLAAVGALAGRTRSERFAWFIYSFGLWDLVYYAFLKIALGWPESLFTWDILFLLPVPWAGPVLAPCIVAATMCGLALTTVWHTDRGANARLTTPQRALLVAGSLVIILSFTLDWIRTDGHTLWVNITQPRDLLYGLGHYVPKHYSWWIFALGEALGLAAWLSYARRRDVTTTTPSSDRSASPDAAPRFG